MIQVVFYLITFFICLSNSIAEEINCNQFDKLSAKYVECSALKLKEKSKDLKNTTMEKIDDSKKKFDGSELKENLIKFKNSKSLSEFMGKN